MAIDWGLVLGAVSAAAVPISFGIGVVAMAKPSPGEFRFARFCFTVAAICTVGSFAWLSHEMPLSLTKIIAAGTFGAFVCIGLVASLDWVSRKQHPDATEKKNLTSQAAPILFNCQLAKLPTTVPAAGQIATMDIASKLDFGAEPLLLGFRHGEPGEKWTWFDSDRELGGVWRCDITNYADFPIFNVAMKFKEEFRESRTTKENLGATSSGDVVDTSDRLVVITNIDAKGTFYFYAYSQSRYYVQVFLPSEVTYLTAGNAARETAQLLPPGIGGGMTFWPVVIKQPKQPEDKQDIKAKFEQFYLDSDALWRRLVMVPKTVSDGDYKKLQSDIDQWSVQLEKFIESALGPVEASRMLDVSSDLPKFSPEAGYRQEIADDRAATLYALNAQRRALAKLIDDQKSSKHD